MEKFYKLMPEPVEIMGRKVQLTEFFYDLILPIADMAKQKAKVMSVLNGTFKYRNESIVVNGQVIKVSNPYDEANNEVNDEANNEVNDEVNDEKNKDLFDLFTLDVFDLQDDLILMTDQENNNNLLLKVENFINMFINNDTHPFTRKKINECLLTVLVRFQPTSHLFNFKGISMDSDFEFRMSESTNRKKLKL